MGGTDGKIKCCRGTLSPGAKEDVSRAAKILAGMFDIWDEKILRLDLRVKPGSITQVSKEVAQDIVPTRSVTAASTQQRVVPLAIHDRAAEGTVPTTREDVSPDTSLDLNYKLGRPHGQAIDK
jgi:hypothetical protein